MNWRSASVRLDRFFGALRGKLSGARIGRGTRISAGSELSVWPGGTLEIGEGCVIHKGAILSTYPGGRIRLGDDCTVNPYCVIYGHGGVEIGNSVRIAAHTVMVSANHAFEDPNLPISKQKQTRKGIRIGDNVWIGAGVRILDGVEIASGSVIAAGAVVNRSTPQPGVYAGVPARLVKVRPAPPEHQLP